MTTCIVTTCVSRWRFLEQSYGTWGRHLSVAEVLCVTSRDCPDLTGIRASQVGMRVQYVDLGRDSRGCPLFHKTRLLNEGVRCLQGSYDWLLLLDADTLVGRGFGEELHRVSAGQFGFCESPLTKRDLAGVLLVRTEDWDRVGGMDEGFVGWGAEDLDLRLRLRYQAGLEYVRLGTDYVQPLAHSDELRVMLRGGGDKFLTLTQNNARMAASFRAATGRELARELAEDVELQELLGLKDELAQRGGSLVTVSQDKA